MPDRFDEPTAEEWADRNKWKAEGQINKPQEDPMRTVWQMYSLEERTAHKNKRGPGRPRKVDGDVSDGS